MHHFIIEITYTAPLDVIDANVGDHRAFLQTGYDQGWLLCSGPQTPKVGGIIVARAPSREELEAFFHNDPYQQRNLATYRIIEFMAVKRQDFLQTWVDGH
ncbi:MAG: hypothetical protein KAX40_02500 [Herpetosiphon sp.]|nr:hypothetical protein [Herpetosiphon sp.]